MNEPDELLHIAMPEDWSAARVAGEYRMSTRGKSLDEVGFVHCSYPSQIEAVANRYFADVAELVLLHLEPELIEPEIRVEAAHDGSGDFPHVYGPIATTAVVATTWWDRDADGMWHKPVTM